MARTWDEDINKHQDWGGDESTQDLPVSGTKVQKFIKDTFQDKIGFVYVDKANSRYVGFADREDYELYISDPSTYSSLIIQSWYGYFPDSPGPGPGPGPTPSLLDHDVFYGSTDERITIENAPIKISSLNQTFSSTCICPSNKQYVYISIYEDYNFVSAETDNHEIIRPDFVQVGGPGTTFTYNNLSYKLYEFTLSSTLPLDVNINITISA